MSDTSLLFYLGATLSASGLVAIIRPQSLVRDSRRNWQARLRELDAGAPEAYFEERRELEAYPPRFDLSHRTLRLLGGVGLILGLLCIFTGLNR
jgi:hypothetical protein